ncbi:hypothetical protein DSM112329_04015 [Paraconexibacter sp. AEG42_29]|uniref:Peptidoglycan endopeptidase n=1 Tax=Paraconexibacter sp. AEG42_29 TaxID=2997339 RepID=A0AAU7AZG0_9ACTN
MSMCSRATSALTAALALGALATGCGSADEKTKTQARASAPDSGQTGTSQRASVPIRDQAEADQAFVTPRGTKLTKKAPAPGAAKAAAKKAVAKTAASGSFGETADNFISPGAPSDAEIAAELRQMEAVQKQSAKSGGNGHGIRLNPDGTATVAPDVPAAVARIVAGANAIAKFPYVYGGGHGSFVDTAYDCSGSLSYALAAGGLLTTTKTSGELALTGEKGPGEWVTIYANAGHTFMVVDGLRYDTSGRSGPRGSRWQTAPRSTKGFAVVHPPGL